MEWLEQHLRARRGALLLVTHDRYLLDRLATRIVEVVDGALHTGYGTYADYLETRALREEQAARVEQKRRNRARTELEWLRRGPARERPRRATASTAPTSCWRRARDQPPPTWSWGCPAAGWARAWSTCSTPASATATAGSCAT